MNRETDTHLYLVGDDEALDVLSELCRYLPLFELARVDELPAQLPASAVVVIGIAHPRVRDAQLALAQSARWVTTLPAGTAQPGARAVLVAAELVRLLVPELQAPPDA